MKLLKYSGKPKRPKLFLRRVVGVSMLPTFRQGQIIVASANVSDVQVGDIVMVQHEGLEKIKRVADLRPGGLFLLGDNSAASSGSRTFGWLDMSALRAKIVWPHSKAIPVE